MQMRLKSSSSVVPVRGENATLRRCLGAPLHLFIHSFFLLGFFCLWFARTFLDVRETAVNKRAKVLILTEIRAS